MILLTTIISTMIPQKEDSSSGKVSKVNEEEAHKTFKYLEELGEIGELTDVDEYLPK